MATGQLYTGQTNCACPTGDLPAPALQTCGKSIGQIVRFAVMKASGTEPFDGTLGNDITLSADWATKLALSGADKLVLSPLFANSTVTGGEMQVEGENDNTTVGGSGRKTRHTDVVLSGSFYDMTADNIQALAEILNCNDQMKFFLVNSDGTLFHVATTAPATNTDMIPSTLTFFNAQNTDGLNASTSNGFTIKFRAEDFMYIESVDLSSFILSIDNP